MVAKRVEAKGSQFADHLAPDLPAWVTGDRLRLEQILTQTHRIEIRRRLPSVVKSGVCLPGWRKYLSAGERYGYP